MPSAFSKERANQVLAKFEELLTELEAARPGDRSAADRYTAITITEVEKAKAIYLTYVEPAAP